MNKIIIYALLNITLALSFYPAHAEEDADPPMGGGLIYYVIHINENSPEEKTAKSEVILQLYGAYASEMRIANESDWEQSSWEPYAMTKNWILSGNDGEKTVCVEFKNNDGELGSACDTISLTTQSPTEKIEPTITTTSIDKTDIMAQIISLQTNLLHIMRQWIALFL